MDRTIKLLRDLISIDSVNPSLVPDGAGEKNIAEAVEAYLRGIGLDVESNEVVPGRQNVVGVLEGRAVGKSLMLCGHLDTVSVEGMDHPFDPVERDGRLGQAGIPSVIFGPGGAGYHGLEEYVYVDEVIACRDALIKVARDFCS